MIAYPLTEGTCSIIALLVPTRSRPRSDRHLAPARRPLPSAGEQGRVPRPCLWGVERGSICCVARLVSSCDVREEYASEFPRRAPCIWAILNAPAVPSPGYLQGDHTCDRALRQLDRRRMGWLEGARSDRRSVWRRSRRRDGAGIERRLGARDPRGRRRIRGDSRAVGLGARADAARHGRGNRTPPGRDREAHGGRAASRRGSPTPR